MSDRLFLCAGLQSSGSSLVSWSFLQRRDMDGVLDAFWDRIPSIPKSAHEAPYVWCKTTIASFHLTELTEWFESQGYEVQPILVVRDVRAVLNSLITKEYGANGTTAEDPPLRLRLMRFHEDWQAAKRLDWPTIVFERFVADPVSELKGVCQVCHLPWDDAMITWPKTAGQIADASSGSETFHRTRDGTLLESIRPDFAGLKVGNVPADELRWVDHKFSDFNSTYGYPALELIQKRTDSALVPSFKNTRRYQGSKLKFAVKGILEKIRGVR